MNLNMNDYEKMIFIDTLPNLSRMRATANLASRVWKVRAQDLELKRRIRPTNKDFEWKVLEKVRTKDYELGFVTKTSVFEINHGSFCEVPHRTCVIWV